LQEGLQKGMQKSMRRALVDILELRGFTVTTEHRARVDACDELETLERWYAKARTQATHVSLERLFE
jgi:hypothetical protein